MATSGAGELDADAASAAAEPEEYTAKASLRAVVGGTKAMAAAQACTQLTRLATNIVLARILVPRDFGLVAIATVVSLFLDQIKDVGTGSAVIQRSKITNALLDTVFWLNLVIGIVMALALVFSAGPLASLMGNDGARNVLRAYAAITFVTALGQVHHALLRRTLRFGAIAVVAAVAAVVTAAVSIVTALLGLHVWSLVIGNAAGPAVGTVMVWIVSNWRPGRGARWVELRSISGFSVNLLLSNLLFFFFSNSDKVLVGRWLGVTALGVYGLAQRILMYPITALGQVIGEVVFPAFARQQHDDAALRDTYVRAARLIALVTFPLMAGAAIVARPLVQSVLGDKWHALPPLMWVLAPIGALQSVTFNSGQLLTAKGKTDVLFRWGLVSSAIVIGAYVIGLHWGLIGVCVAYAIAIVILTPIGSWIAFRLIGLSLRTYGRELAPTTIITGAMVGVVLGVDSLVAHIASSGVVLTTAIATGVVTYVGLNLWWRPRVLDDVRVVLKTKTRGGDEPTPVVVGAEPSP